MDITFEWDGETFKLHNDSDRWTLGEARAVERWIGLPMEAMSTVDQVTAAIGVSIKRSRPTFNIRDTDNVPMSVVSTIMEQVQKQRDSENVPPAEADAEPDAEAASAS